MGAIKLALDKDIQARRPKLGAVRLSEKEVDAYTTRARALTSSECLHAFLGEITERFGFAFFSLSAYHEAPEPRVALYLTNLPTGLQQIIVERNYLKQPWVTELGRDQDAGFKRTDVKAVAAASASKAEMVAAYDAFGVGDAFVVPGGAIDGVYGTIKFAVRAGEDLPVRMLPFAQYFGALAFDAARRMVTGDKARPLPIGELTFRQRECCILVAQGKSDWETGQILGISSETVHKHIQAAMKRYGVTTRTQLVVSALHQTHISFDDILG